MILEWREVETTSYGHIAHYGRCGEIDMFTVGWSLSGKYALRGHLPGFKKELGDFDTVEAGKTCAEAVLALWLKKAGLSVGKEGAR
jgi:hypothetical protein